MKRRATEPVITAKLATTLDKCKVSKKNAPHLLVAIAEAYSVDVKNKIINETSVHEARQKYRQERYDIIKNLVPEIFSNAATTIHWDGKMLPGILRNESSERLAIIITSNGVEQLLGVPAISRSTGQHQAAAVFEHLVDWSVVDNVEALCCDSTASNTGRVKGACIKLEQALDKDLLYLICRHHIYELVLKCTFEIKFGKSTAPDVTFFKEFEGFWKYVKQNEYENGLSDSYVKEHLKDEQDRILLFCSARLEQRQPRSDYKEFLELVIIFLGGELPTGTTFHPPGAIHNARWMAKAIYCLKIFLFRKQFLTDRKEDELKCRDVCIFIVRLYVQAWFCAPEAPQAPSQDLKFLKDLHEYKTIDKNISEATVKKFMNHLWYLTPELAALSFFDSNLADSEKRLMCEALNLKRSSFSYEKRILADRKNIKQISEASLSDFICKDSLNFFNRYQINPTFLTKDPSKWKHEKNFIAGLDMVKNLKTVNDVAEREVKLMTDFNNILTKDEQQRKYLLPVIKEYRNFFPNCTKETLMKQY